MFQKVKCINYFCIVPKAVLYKTFTSEFPMKFSPSTQAEFISDTQLRITYLTGEDNDEKIELFTIG